MLQRCCLFIFVVLFLTSCFTKTEEIVIAKYADNSPKLVKYYLVHSAQSKELVKEVAYYPKHKKLIEGSYADSLRNGLWQSWYENGNLWSESEYEKGIRHGRCATYYDNGKLRYKGSYANDKKEGEWVFYDSTGTEINKFNFDIVNK